MNNSFVSPDSVGCSAERLARIKPFMQSYIDCHGFSGLTTLLARRGGVVHCEHVGFQDRDRKTPLSDDTIFRIYSMTKPIISAALMTLYEEGRFQLTDSVSKYISAFRKTKVLHGTLSAGKEVDLVRPVTVRDLLTHTAGLTYNFLEDSPVSELYRSANLMSDPGRPLESMINELARIPLAYQPGTTWHYSMATDVIAHLIEVLSGQPLQDFLQQRLFSPLGMNSTGFSVSPAEHHRIATMYGHPDITTSTFSTIIGAWKSGFNEQIDVETTYPAANSHSFARGGHGLFSTARDYLRFAQMLLNRGTLDGVRILSPRIVDFMHLNHLQETLLPFGIGGIMRSGYGFGLGSRVLLNVAESALPGSIGEYGWAGAAKTYFWVDPKEELIGILMAQYMVSFDTPERDFQLLAYQALE
ncbi:MAG: serine hydrolase [Desulfuromonadaceae bacterium]|nr:serine hydrolase [Desulfuromonadaceae bacterium]